MARSKRSRALVADSFADAVESHDVALVHKQLLDWAAVAARAKMERMWAQHDPMRAEFLPAPWPSPSRSR